ncbi:ribokinase-like isoform X2 [Lycorma delicatula]|uniref:ribokinase-like isoform X2 n=1 Tax=Lycorma delicatula TaxID=130591 RepID=UPI003F5195DE
MFYTDRIPKRGETIYGKKFTSGFGGKGANQCIAAAKLGASTAMIARLGDDNFGKEYFDLLKKHNVNTSHVMITSGISSGVAQITVSESEGDNYILIVEGANGLLSPMDVELAADIIKQAKVGLFQLEIPLETSVAAMKLFKEKSNAVLMFNPSPAKENIDPIIFTLCDILVVNETEAEMITKVVVKTIEDAYAALKSFIKLGCKTAIISLGSQGAAFATKTQKEPVHVKVNPIDNPVDTTGAGDLFLGALAYSFIYKNHLNLNEKIMFSCNIARECVQKAGAQDSFPYLKDIPHLMK